MNGNQEPDAHGSGYHPRCQSGEGQRAQTDPHIIPNTRTTMSADDGDDEEQETLKQTNVEAERSRRGHDNDFGRANVDDVDTGAGVKEADKRL